MGEEVGPPDGRDTGDHGGQGVAHEHGAPHLPLVHELDQVVREPVKRVPPLLPSAAAAAAGEVPVEQENLGGQVRTCRLVPVNSQHRQVDNIRIRMHACWVRTYPVCVGDGGQERVP